MFVWWGWDDVGEVHKVLGQVKMGPALGWGCTWIGMNEKAGTNKWVMRVLEVPEG